MLYNYSYNLIKIDNFLTNQVFLATETVLSPWLAADEARVSHVLSHVV